MDKSAVFIDQGYFGRVLAQFDLQKTVFNPDNTVVFENNLKIILYCFKSKTTFSHPGLRFACDERYLIDRMLFSDCLL